MQSLRLGLIVTPIGAKGTLVSFYVNRVIHLDEYNYEGKFFFRSAFQSDKMIENKGKLRARSINHGGPIKSHS